MCLEICGKYLDKANNNEDKLFMKNKYKSTNMEMCAYWTAKTKTFDEPNFIEQGKKPLENLRVNLDLQCSTADSLRQYYYYEKYDCIKNERNQFFDCTVHGVIREMQTDLCLKFFLFYTNFVYWK